MIIYRMRNEDSSFFVVKCSTIEKGWDSCPRQCILSCWFRFLWKFSWEPKSIDEFRMKLRLELNGNIEQKDLWHSIISPFLFDDRRSKKSRLKTFDSYDYYLKELSVFGNQLQIPFYDSFCELSSRKTMIANHFLNENGINYSKNIINLVVYFKAFLSVFSVETAFIIHEKTYSFNHFIISMMKTLLKPVEIPDIKFLYLRRVSKKKSSTFKKLMKKLAPCNVVEHINEFWKKPKTFWFERVEGWIELKEFRIFGKKLFRNMNGKSDGTWFY